MCQRGCVMTGNIRRGNRLESAFIDPLSHTELEMFRVSMQTDGINVRSAE